MFQALDIWTQWIWAILLDAVQIRLKEGALQFPCLRYMKHSKGTFTTAIYCHYINKQYSYCAIYITVKVHL